MQHWKTFAFTSWLIGASLGQIVVAAPSIVPATAGRLGLGDAADYPFVAFAAAGEDLLTRIVGNAARFLHWSGVCVVARLARTGGRAAASASHPPPQWRNASHEWIEDTP